MPGDGSSICLGYQRRKIDNKILIRLARQLRWKDAVMQMFLHLYEDFDDDLLLDAMSLLFRAEQ